MQTSHHAIRNEQRSSRFITLGKIFAIVGLALGLMSCGGGAD